MNISDAESEIMKVLWTRSPLSADEIAAEIAGNRDWTKETVRTLINRLHKKGAVSAEKEGRKFLYQPVVSRADYLDDQSQGLLDRLFDGRLAPLVSHFTQRRKLSAEDLADLKRLIAQIEEEDD